MRLIDADKLKPTTGFYIYESEKEEDTTVISTEMYRKELIEREAPTVEAIPKEWIINWLTKQTIPALHTCDYYEAVNMMLDDWEKENETN